MLLHFDGHIEKPYIKVMEVSKMNEINRRRQYVSNLVFHIVPGAPLVPGGTRPWLEILP